MSIFTEKLVVGCQFLVACRALEWISKARILIFNNKQQIKKSPSYTSQLGLFIIQILVVRCKNSCWLFVFGCQWSIEIDTFNRNNKPNNRQPTTSNINCQFLVASEALKSIRLTVIINPTTNNQQQATLIVSFWLLVKH